MAATFQTVTFCLLSWYPRTYTNRTCKTCIFLVVLYGCETWSHHITLMDVWQQGVGVNSRTKGEAAIKLRKLHNDEFVSYTTSPFIVDVIKSRRIRWVGHVTSTAEKWNAYRVLVSKIEGKRSLRNLGVDVRTKLVRILKKCDGSAWTGATWFKVGTWGEILCVG